ncbi:CzcE family metal-binding protein [Cupriavidus basilensis]
MIDKNLAILVLCTAFIGTAQAATIGSSAKLFGNQAPEAYAARTVTLGGKTNQIIVASGETVTFRAASQSVNWTFLESIEPQAVESVGALPGSRRREERMGVHPTEREL